MRFLEIADKLKIKVAIVTDNDGDIEAIKTKYVEYIGDKKKAHIDICFDDIVDFGDLTIKDKPFNYNTLEPKMVKANGLDQMNKILGQNETLDGLYQYMNANKTACALKIFETKEPLEFPKYIIDSRKHL